jgi:trigger factor
VQPAIQRLDLPEPFAEHHVDVVAWYYADEKRLHDVQQMVLEDQVVEWLVAQAKVSDDTVSFSDVMDKQQQ